MKRFRITIILLEFVFFYLTASTDEQEVINGELGKSIVLPCLEAPLNTTLTVTRWLKSGVVLVSRNHSQPGGTRHLSILDDGSLSISDLLSIDEAEYQCDPEPKTSNTSHKILLQVTDGPTNMTVTATGATLLPNGTWTILRGARVSVKCSSKSYPSQSLSWYFEQTRRKYENTSLLKLGILNIQPIDQGNYTCTAQNLVSKKTVTRNLELLIYYPPERHPDCIWHPGDQLDQVYFNCSWYGGCPASTLTVFLDSSSEEKPTQQIGSQQTENFEISLNRSMVHQGQKITCVGHHVAQNPGEDKTCTFTLEPPYPVGEPMVTVLEGNNVTLKCSEFKSLPPAKTKWQQGLNKKDISPSSKYILAEQGPEVTLTIVSASREDEGVFFCQSENVLGDVNLEVYLTVRSSASSGAAVGVFISLFVVVAGVILGYFLYSRRDRICLGFHFGHLQNDTVDTISLIESDDDEIFQSSVPRLPSLANGHSPSQPTTLVEIHRIHSNDHEETVNDANQVQTQDQMQPDEES